MPLSTPPHSLLPPNGILLHIGPHKTGTTALQSALTTSRETLAAAGVLVPDEHLLYRGATALTGLFRDGMEPGEKPPIGEWERLDGWVRQHPMAKLVLSSEWFDDCTPEMIATIRDSWGQDRLRVMITIRPLERLLPSTWQQAVKTGSRRSLEAWLRPRLEGPHSPRDKRASRFWYRHDHAALVERWAGVLGIDNVVVVIADEREPTQLYRHTEVLLSLPEGSITPGVASNRSLTLPEIAAVQAMYRAVLPTDSAYQRHKWLQRGAVLHLVETRVPPRNEGRIRIPAASVARIREIAQDISDRLASSGVTVMGDVGTLVSHAPIPADIESDSPVLIDPEIGALLSAGLYRAAATSAATAEKRIREAGGRASSSVAQFSSRAVRWVRRRLRG